MRTEDEAWRELREMAAGEISADFARRVVRAANGPDATVWDQLFRTGAAEIRPGFAGRVLRAVARIPVGPSTAGQIILGFATAGVCLLAVVAFHSYTTQAQEQRNLARWHQLAADVQDLDAIQ